MRWAEGSGLVTSRVREQPRLTWSLQHAQREARRASLKRPFGVEIYQGEPEGLQVSEPLEPCKTELQARGSMQDVGR